MQDQSVSDRGDIVFPGDVAEAFYVIIEYLENLENLVILLGHPIKKNVVQTFDGIAAKGWSRRNLNLGLLKNLDSTLNGYCKYNE